MMRYAALAGVLGYATACQSTARSADEATSSSAPTQTAQPATAASACGAKSQPDCPLQGWMKSTLQVYLREKNYTRLASSLQELAANAPDGYANWKELALAAAAAAAEQDETAVSKNCKSCHNEHRSRFRKERRAVPLF